MLSFFQSIIDAISSFFSMIVSTIQSLVQAISYIFTASGTVTKIFVSLPVAVFAIISAALTIYIMFKILKLFLSAV